LIIITGAYGIFKLRALNGITETVYNDRVIAMSELINVRYSYGMVLLSSVEKLESHEFNDDQAYKWIEENEVKIHTNWEAYKLTCLTPEEAQLVKKTQSVMNQTDSSIAKLKIFLKKGDAQAIKEFAITNLYSHVNPIAENFRALMDLQLRVSKEKLLISSKIYYQSSRNFYILILLSLAFAIALGVFITKDIRDLIEELQEINRKIRESEEKCRAFIENAGDGIFMMDEDLRFTDMNEYACKMLGYTKQELLGLRVSEITSQNEIERQAKEIDLLRKNQRFLIERTLIRKDGTGVDTEVNTRKMGEAFIAVVRDITERKQAEAKILQRESQLTAFFENIEGAASLLDEEKKYILFNHRFIYDHRLLTNHDPYIGQEVWDMFPDDIRKERHKMLESVLSGNREVVEVDYIREGKRVCYRTSLTPVIMDGKVTGISTYSIDLTKSKEAEINIRESEKKYRNIFENIQDVFFQTSLDGVILEVSPSIENIAGFNREAAIGTNAANFYLYHSEREVFVKLLKEKGEVREAV